MESLEEQKVNSSRQDNNLYFDTNKKESNDNSITEMRDIELINKKIIDFIQSPFAISYYYNIIKNRYPTINITKEEINMLLTDYIKNNKIYLIPQNSEIYGLTLNNKIIYINKNYFDSKLEINNSSNIIIFLTIIHELAHVIIKLFCESDYFLNNKLNNDKNNNNHYNMMIKFDNNKLDNKSGHALNSGEFPLPKGIIDKN